jgi:hypothetical protein
MNTHGEWRYRSSNLDLCARRGKWPAATFLNTSYSMKSVWLQIQPRTVSVSTANVSIYFNPVFPKSYFCFFSQILNMRKCDSSNIILETLTDLQVCSTLNMKKWFSECRISVTYIFLLVHMIVGSHSYSAFTSVSVRSQCVMNIKLQSRDPSNSSQKE